MFSKVKGAVEIPRQEDLNPTIGEIRNKIEQFRRERKAAIDEEQDWAAQVREDDASRLQVDRVAELLGKAPATIAVPREERRRELRQRVVDIDRATEILENALVAEIGRATALAAERVLPDYRKAVGALADALQAVQDAYQNAEKIQDVFATAGYSAALLTAHSSHILRGGEQSDVSMLESDLRKWLKAK